MFHVSDEETSLRIEIAEANYLIHFRERFPSDIFFEEEIDSETAEKIEKVVEKCISQNKTYVKPDGYEDRLY